MCNRENTHGICAIHSLRHALVSWNVWAVDQLGAQKTTSQYLILRNDSSWDEITSLGKPTLFPTFLEKRLAVGDKNKSDSLATDTLLLDSATGDEKSVSVEEPDTTVRVDSI